MKPVMNVTLAEAVIAEVLKAITSGEFKPGQKLPSERELMTRFAVSRPIIREALRGLAMLNAIEVRAGRGAVVRDLRKEPVINPALLGLALDAGEELRQLHELRCILEVPAAGLAAERASEEDLKALEDTLQGLRESFQREESFPAREFHLGIARASGNPLLLQVLRPVLELLDQHLKRRPGPLFSTPDEEYQIHKELLDVIKQRNPATAMEAMRRHIEMSYQRWLPEALPKLAAQAGQLAVNAATGGNRQ